MVDDSDATSQVCDEEGAAAIHARVPEHLVLAEAMLARIRERLAVG